MKNLFYVVGLVWSLGLGATEYTHVFHVSTEIKKVNLYGYTLTITPQPASLTLMFNDESKSFDPIETLLLISTNIPKTEEGLGFDYHLSLNTNTSECHNINDDLVVTQEDFISLFLDGESFTDSTSVLGQSLYPVDNNDNLVGENTLRLVSSTINSVAQSCSGEIVIEAELSL